MYTWLLYMCRASGCCYLWCEVCMVAVCREEWLPAIHVLASSGYVMAMCRVCSRYVQGMWLLHAEVCGCYVQGYVVATCRGMWSLCAWVCGRYVQAYVIATCRGTRFCRILVTL